MLRNVAGSREYSGLDMSSTLPLLVRRLRQNSLYLIIIMLTILTGITIGIVKPGVGYEVLLNGEHLGYTHDPMQVRRMLQELDNDLRVSKGDDIDYVANLSFVEGKIDTASLNSADDLKLMIASNIEVKKPAYLVKTSSGIAFAVANEETARNVFENIKKPYIDGRRNATAEIINGVHLVESDNVPVEKILNNKQAIAYINSPMARGISSSSSEEDILRAGKPLFDVKVEFDDTVQRPVLRGVTTVGDDSMYEGESYVQSEGSDGVKSQERRVTEINGVEAESYVLSETVIEEPVDKVIVVGTKPKIPPILKTAYQYLGVPYVWGGTTPSGFDCSGFVQYVYRQHGIYLPRTTYSQVNCGTPVSYSNAMPGDLLHFPGHIGIYIGNGQMIHAPRPGRSVEIAPVGGRNLVKVTRVL